MARAHPDEVDLNAHDDPPELHDVVVRVRARLPEARGTIVGHADWESQNIR